LALSARVHISVSITVGNYNLAIYLDAFIVYKEHILLAKAASFIVEVSLTADYSSRVRTAVFIRVYQEKVLVTLLTLILANIVN
jgi:hypothetical protein